MKTKLRNPNNIFIPYQVPSSKNGRKLVFPKTKEGKLIILKNGEPKTIVVNSGFTSFYIKRTDAYYRLLKEEFDRLTTGLKKPLKVRLTFYRTHEEKWDFINLAQVIQDQMKKWKWVEDDDKQNLLCYPPIHYPYYKVDKINPGVLITILP